MEKLDHKQFEKLVENINANLAWYLQISVFAGILLAFRTFGWRLWSGIRKLTFSLLAAPLDWTEMTITNDETIQLVSNLLRRLKFDTRRVYWKYDVNAAARDDIMIGTVRLPTASWFIWCMSLLEVCNYIWIDDKAKMLHYVGPTPILLELVDVSNLLKGQQAQIESHLEVLREIITACSKSRLVQVCAWIELLLVVTALSSVGFFYTWKVPLFVGAASILFHVSGRVRRRLVCCQHFFPRTGNDAREEDSLGLELRLVDSQEEHFIAIPDYDSPQIKRNYSILLPHSGGWYDIARNKEYERSEGIRRDLNCDGSRNLVTLQVKETNPDKLVQRLNFTGERCIYMCAHNPLASVTSITALRKMINNADNSIVLVIILPEIGLISAALENTGRIGYPDHQSPITSYADWHGWIQQVTSGIFECLLLVLPYSQPADLQCVTYTISCSEMDDLSHHDE